MVINLEMVLRELLSLLYLLRAQIFNIPKLIEIVIIGKYKNFIFIAF